MRRQGWQEGRGLGAKGRGMEHALDIDGQVPSDKKGFG